MATSLWIMDRAGYFSQIHFNTPKNKNATPSRAFSLSLLPLSRFKPLSPILTSSELPRRSMCHRVVRCAATESGDDEFTAKSGECRVANGLDCFEYPAISCRKHSAVLTDFGGVGDGKTSNTKAFQYAISNLSHYASDGGALLVVPPGKWLTGSFNLTSHFTLFLQKEATILGSQDELEWPTLPVLPSYGRGRDAPDGQGIFFKLDTKLDEQKVSDKYCEAGPAGAEHEAVPLWLHPQMKSSNNNVAAVVPDPELTLAVSKGKAKTLLGLEQTQTKSSPDSFLLGPISILEETCESLLGEKFTLAAEKATLFSQLQTTVEKLEKLSEKNHLLESSLFNVNSELEGLRIKSKILEDSCLLFDHEKSSLTSDKEMEEHSKIVQLNDCQLAEKELQIFVLQEDADYQKKEFEEELDRAVHAQMEIFILQKCIQGSEQKNFSLLVESQKLLESSKLSDRLVSKLENDNVQKQVDVNSLSEKIKILRIGLLQALKTLDVNSEPWCDVAIENSVLVTFLGQLKLKAENLLIERDSLDKELRTQSKQFLALQAEVQKILEKNQELKLTISKGEGKMEALKELSKDLDRLCSINTDLEEKLKIMMGKLEDVQMENSDLKESLIVSSNELKLVQSVNDQLNCQIRNGKELLSQKENEILEAAKMFSTLHDEKTELQRLVEDLKSKYDGARVILEDQASQILKLSSDKDTQAATLYTRLQISAVNETLFEEKVRELADACEDLDRRSNFKGMENETLKERVNKLEGENGRLRGHFVAYVPAISAFNDCITSLEMQTLAHANPHNYKVLKVKIRMLWQQMHFQASKACRKGSVQLKWLLNRWNESFKTKDEMREIQVLKSGISRRHENIQASKYVEQKAKKSVSDVPVEEIEVLSKDIKCYYIMFEHI
ncbi:hypothetical protein JHK85_009902 [Glycine max]|nr:hypothetical protein JHK85_009902 [Glycine max]